jgi:hypothetical protein
VLVALWGVYWYAGSTIADAVIDRGLAAANTRGNSAACADRRSGGFPISVDFACSTAQFDGAGDGLSASVAGLAVTAPLYRPGHVEAKAAGPLLVDMPSRGIAVTIKWQEADASAGAGIDGLDKLGASAKGVTLEGPVETRRLSIKAASAESAAFAGGPGERKDNGYRLVFDLRALKLDPGDGRDLPPIDLSGSVNLKQMGRSLGFDPEKTLSAWLHGDAGMKIEALDFGAGGFSGSVSGDLKLDENRLLNGKLSLRFRNLDSLPDLVEAFRPGSRKDVAQIAKLIGATTKKVKDGDGEARETVMNFRNGVVAVGIIPLAALPPVSF